MKRITLFLIVATLLAGFTACEEHYTTYSDAEYVIFSDTLSTNMVVCDADYFSVAVTSTVKRDYDRTFGVEIVDEGSNAVEGLHYRLLSNTVTIPAGQLTSAVKVKGLYENIEATDSLGFRLRLILPEALKWDLYAANNETKVVMYKSCPFEINDFTGWCVLTSLYLYSYPGTNPSYQRLVYTRIHPTEPDKIIVEDAFYDGYDITLGFDNSDLANPLLLMDRDQILSDEQTVFGQVLGDNHILGRESSAYISNFNSCQRFATLWLEVYVENLGESVGTVGHFYNIFEWITDEEAHELQQDGM